MGKMKEWEDEENGEERQEEDHYNTEQKIYLETEQVAD